MKCNPLHWKILPLVRYYGKSWHVMTYHDKQHGFVMKKLSNVIKGDQISPYVTKCHHVKYWKMSLNVTILNHQRLPKSFKLIWWHLVTCHDIINSVLARHESLWLWMHKGNFWTHLDTLKRQRTSTAPTQTLKHQNRTSDSKVRKSSKVYVKTYFKTFLMTRSMCHCGRSRF